MNLQPPFDFVEAKKLIESKFKSKGWITIYNKEEDEINEVLIMSGIVPNEEVDSCLKNRNWDIDFDKGGKATVVSSYENKVWKHKYYSRTKDKLESLVIAKSFIHIDGKIEYIDISEEFVLYFNLIEKRESNQSKSYFFIDELGELEEVISVENNIVKFKITFLNEYLLIRKCSLVICFDFSHLIQKKLSELNLESSSENFVSNEHYIDYAIRELDFSRNACQGWLNGKLVINPDKSVTSKFHFELDNRYESYIVSVNDDGDFVYEDCSQKDSNLFTLTYFKKEVLDKYLNNPSRYEVTSFLVRSSFFRLKIDNDCLDHVPVFLTNLSEIPYKEQKHWSQYNIEPKDKISKRYYDTQIEGNWSKHAETPDIYFRERLKDLNSKWENKFGWKLFKPLSSKDSYFFNNIHIPTTPNDKSFHQLLLALAKVLIDSLNEKELMKGLEGEKNIKGIGKLEKFFNSKNTYNTELIKFLKHLQNLRSGIVAHRFSESNKSLKSSMKYFNFENRTNIEISKEILEGCIGCLNSLELGFIEQRNGIEH